MSAMTYLSKHPVSGVYRFRRGIPPELREAIGRGREWHESLGTKDVREAKRLIPEVATRVQEAFDRAEKGEESHNDVVTASDAEQFAALWLSERMDADEDWRMENVPPEDYDDVLSDIYSRVLEGLEDFPRPRSLMVVERDIRDVCEKHGLQVKTNSTSYRRIGHALLLNQRKWLEMIRDRNAGEWPEFPRPSNIPATRRSDPGVGSETAPISAMLEGWLREKQPQPKTTQEWTRAVRRWTELHGDTPVNTITRAMVAAFKDALLKAPARPPHAVRALPLPELIAAVAGDSDIKIVSPTAVNKTLAAIRSILTYAVNNGQLEVNPASRVAALVPRTSEDEERQPFTDAQVCMILAAALERPREADRWLPWMAALMGARQDEMASASVPHVETSEDGITFLRFTDAGEGRSLKGRGARRIMPIHPLLIRLGFLEYVRGLPKDGKLFPGCKSSAYSKRFGRMLDKLGMDDPTLVFHSFRHTFITASRSAGVGEEVRERLVGHAPANVGRGYGEIGLAVLDKAVRAVKYRGLEAVAASSPPPRRAGR